MLAELIGLKTFGVSPSDLLRKFRWRLIGTYTLFTLDNLAMIAQPYLMGVTIDDCLRGSRSSLFWFAALSLVQIAVSVVRRTADTRVFASLYAEVATQLVVDQNVREVPVSTTVARASLCRSFVDFLERDLPMIVQAAFGFIGAIVMLVSIDPAVAGFGAALTIPIMLINWRYSLVCLHLNRDLHDQMEYEVEAIASPQRPVVCRHFHRLMSIQVKLSDSQALNFGASQLLSLAFLLALLVRASVQDELSLGSLTAVLRYVMLMVAGLEVVPLVVNQVARMRDIFRRVQG